MLQAKSRRPLMGVVISTITLLASANDVLADKSPSELRKLYALLVVDTLSGLGDSVKVDGERIERLLQSGIPRDRLDLTILTGKDVTSVRILDYFKRSKAGPSDGLMFYYAGHGAVDPEKGHFLALQKLDTKPLARSDLKKAMEQLHPGLVVILTDCCSTRYKLEKKTRKVIVDAGGQAKSLDPALRSLLFQHRGVVDITAATDNAAVGDDDDGGLFTRTLASSIARYSRELKSDSGKIVVWKELFPQVQQETMLSFSRWAKDQRARGEKLDQKTQKPRAFTLPEPPGGPGLILVNGSNLPLHYRFYWGNEGTFERATLAAGGTRWHSVPISYSGDEIPRMQIKFEDEEPTSLKVGKSYRYTPDHKKKRSIDLESEPDQDSPADENAPGSPLGENSDQC